MPRPNCGNSVLLKGPVDTRSAPVDWNAPAVPEYYQDYSVKVNAEYTDPTTNITYSSPATYFNGRIVFPEKLPIGPPPPPAMGAGGWLWDDGDYSLMEEQVGTWEDGRPIWRKSFIYTYPSNSVSGTVGTLSAAPSIILHLGGCLVTPTTVHPAPDFKPFSNNGMLEFTATNFGLNIFGNRIDFAKNLALPGGTIYVIIVFVK